MEGIDRLAINKLLLVEVEKEIGRRVTRICTNDSVFDLSSMKQFLFDLIQNPPPMGIILDADNPSRFLNSELEERVAKNTVTSSRCSQHESSKHDAAPEILVSKSGSTSPLLRNGMPQHLKETLELPVRLSKELFPATPLVETSCEKGDIILDARNQSSSASEERLPKHVGNGPSDLMQAACRDNLQKDENKQHCDIDSNKVNSIPMDIGKVLDHEGSKILCDTEMTDIKFLEAENPGHGKVAGFSRLILNRAEGKHDSSEARTPASLPAKFSDHNLSDGSKGKCLCLNVQVNKCNDQNFYIVEPESKGESKKRPAESEPFLGEDVHLGGRRSKRILLKVSSESGKAAAFMRQDSLKQRMSEYNGRRKHSSEINDDQAITISNGGSEKGAEVDLPDDSVSSKDGTPSIPCSCGHQTFDALTDSLSASQQNPLTQGRCEDCGCSLSQSLDQHNKDMIDGNASLDLDYQKALVEPSSLVPGCPILATQ